MDFINQDNYRAFPAVANSDLSWLQKYWEPEEIRFDKEKAFKFGNLLDAMITERHRLNFFNFTVDKVQYTREDWDRCTEMKKAYDADPLCNQMRQNCNFQHITYVPNFRIEFDGFQFTLPAKCKWDLFCPNMDLGGDIKSTAATTQKQFEEACHYFDYFRSRAWYMDLAGRSNDILIGISKKNNQVFKIPIRRGDKYYKDGKAAYQELAFQYWSLFSGIMANNSKQIVSDAARPLNLVSPFLKWSDDIYDYKHLEDLSELIEACKGEVKLYLFEGKHAPDNQLKLFSTDEESENEE